MASDPLDIRDFFLQDVPDEYLDGLVTVTFEAYADADKDCKDKDYPKSEYLYLLPHTRRAKMEFYHRSWAKRKGLSAHVFPNIKRSAEHTRIRIGRFCITISSVDDSGSLPRQAHFRSAYAKSPQSSFAFDEDGRVYMVSPQIESEDEYYYAILTHRSSRDKHAVPDLINIEFPNANYTDFLCPSINLISRFLANIAASSDVETIRDEVKLSIIENQDEERASEA